MQERPITDLEIARIVGRLEGHTHALQTSVAQLHVDVRVIREAVSEDKGKWKVLAGVSGIAATIAGGVVATAQWLFYDGA